MRHGLTSLFLVAGVALAPVFGETLNTPASQVESAATIEPLAETVVEGDVKDESMPPPTPEAAVPAPDEPMAPSSPAAGAPTAEPAAPLNPESDVPLRATTKPLAIPSPPVAKTLNMPGRSMTMEAVESKFGTPQRKHDAVGIPPISRWDYADYSVFFENNLVIDSVAHQDP